MRIVSSSRCGQGKQPYTVGLARTESADDSIPKTIGIGDLENTVVTDGAQALPLIVPALFLMHIDIARLNFGILLINKESLLFTLAREPLDEVFIAHRDTRADPFLFYGFLPFGLLLPAVWAGPLRFEKQALRISVGGTIISFLMAAGVSEDCDYVAAFTHLRKPLLLGTSPRLLKKLVNFILSE
jgi:hypothetical protein